VNALAKAQALGLEARLQFPAQAPVEQKNLRPYLRSDAIENGPH